MFKKLIAVAMLFVFVSCNDNAETGTKEVKTETTTNTSTDDDAPGDKEAQKQALNEQSRALIALMNTLEEEQSAAYAAGDAAKASALKARIDSAARENARIGIKLMELEK